MGDSFTEVMEKQWPTLKTAIVKAQEGRAKLESMIGVTTTDDSRPFRIGPLHWTPPDQERQQAEAKISWAHRVRVERKITFDELTDPSSLRGRLEEWAKDHKDDERDAVFDLVAEHAQEQGSVVPYEIEAIRDRLSRQTDAYRLIGPKADEATAKALVAQGIVKDLVEAKSLKRDHHLLTRIREGPTVVRMGNEQSPTWVRRDDRVAIIQITSAFFFEEGLGSIKVTKT